MNDVATRLTSLSERKQKLLNQLLAERSRPVGIPPLAPRPPGADPVPLAAAQRGLWFLSRLAPDSSFYHMPYAVHLSGRLDVAALGRAFNAMVERHEALRTTFPERGGKPVQRIAPRLPLALPVTDLGLLPEGEREAEALRRAAEQAMRPFDLVEGPLLRAALYRLGAEEHLLMFSMHHIASDGWSVGVMLQELGVLYEAFRHGLPDPLPPLAIQYADFVLWQEQWFAGGALDGQLAYWRRKLDKVAPLALPTDFPRPAVQSYRGASEPLRIPETLTGALEELARREGATLFMVVLAAFQALLFLHSGTRRVVVGTPIANRKPRETEALIGFFANTLALCTDCGGEPSFRDLLARAKETTLEAFANQDVPFDLLVEAVQAERDPSRNPLFQVMFGLQSVSVRDFGLAGLSASPRTLENDTTHFDMELQLWQHGDHLSGYVSYNLALFGRETTVRLIDRLQALLAVIVADPAASLGALAAAAGIPPLEAVPRARTEAALLALAAIEDCAVLSRERGETVEMVAYVVPAPCFVDDETVCRALPAALAPAALVPVSAIPRTADGAVDEAALLALPVIDAGLIARWREALGSEGGEVQARVEIAPKQEERRPWLHLADLLSAAPALEKTERSPASSSPGAVSASPAHADGGPLDIPPDAPRTLTDALLRTATDRADQGIVFVLEGGESRFLSYGDLKREALAILAGLQAQGLKAGDRVILQLANLPDHFCTFWACVLGGITPVTTALPPSHREKGGVLNKLWNVWTLLGGPVVLTNAALVPKLAAVPALYDGEADMAFRAWAVADLRGSPEAAHIHPADPEDVVFLQLTSGSTGVPKCVRETHRAIIHHVHGSARFNGVGPEDIDLNWLPLDHVVPTLTCHLRDTYLGMRQIQVASTVVLTEPSRWLDLIETHKVTHSWAPNFGFKLLSDRVARTSGRRWDLSSIKVFMNAGEQVTLPVAREFLRLLAPFGLRADAMQPAFGMAEVSTCMTYHNGFTGEGGVHHVLKSSLDGPLRMVSEEEAADGAHCVTFVDLGPPMPGVEIRITDAENRVVPERTIGRFQIRGRMVMPGYLDNPKANEESFVGDGWFDSGDLGFISEGRLVMTGRAKETIIIRGANFYCHEIEEVVNGVDGVLPTFTAACAVHVPQKGTEGLAVFYVPRSDLLPADPATGQRIRDQVARQLGIAPDFVVPLAKEDFPKTTSGKIQRIQLKQALEAGGFAATLKAIDLAEENANCLPDWFFRRVWQVVPPRRGEGEGDMPEAGGASLIFADGGGIADHLLARDAGAVRVDPGAAFARLGATHYQIDPSRAEHYAALLAALAADGLRLRRVVHLWSLDDRGLDPAMARTRGSLGILFLAQALARLPEPPKGLSLVVCSGGIQTVADDEVPDWRHAPLLGLMRSLARELPGLGWRHVDLPADDPSAVNAARIIDETETIDKEAEVAYRAAGRLVPGLARAALVGKRPLALKRGGLYWLSGGIGGIGRLLARYLLTHWQARLVLIGRTPAEHRAEALAELERLDGTVRYVAADVADAAGMRAALGGSEPPDGIFHLAGGFPTRALTEETAKSFAEALSARVEGAQVLHGLAPPGALFVHVASVNGVFGGAMAGAYAAANSFAAAFAQWQRRVGGLEALCLAFSLWDEVGMSLGYPLKEQSRAQGYIPVDAGRGLNSLLIGLMAKAPHLLIGLDPDRPNVRRHLRRDCRPLTGLRAYVVGATGGQAGPPPLDRYGTPCPCAVIPVDHLPDEREGKGAGGQAPAVTSQTQPTTALQQTIAGIWREVLALPSVGIHQSFFEIGGQSLALVQVHSRLQETLNREIQVVDLLQYPTIATLAAFLGEAPGKAAAFDDAKERARRQHLSRQRRRPGRIETHETSR